MPNQRSPGQKLVPIPMKGDFIKEIDKAVEESGCGDRSKFIRDAIYEKLERMGIENSRNVSAPPSRVGKGGPRYPAHKPNNLMINSSEERPVSKAAISDALAAEPPKPKGKRRRPPT